MFDHVHGKYSYVSKFRSRLVMYIDYIYMYIYIYIINTKYTFCFILCYKHLLLEPFIISSIDESVNVNNG